MNKETQEFLNLLESELEDYIMLGHPIDAKIIIGYLRPLIVGELALQKKNNE